MTPLSPSRDDKEDPGADARGEGGGGLSRSWPRPHWVAVGAHRPCHEGEGVGLRRGLINGSRPRAEWAC